MRSAIYDVLQATAVTDKPGFDKAIATLGASLSSFGGRVLADADTTNSLDDGKGPASPAHMSIVVFDGTPDAQAWQKSPAFQDLSTALKKVANVSLYEMGGIPDPGRSLPALAGHGTPGAALGYSERKLPDIPNIGEICKGC